MQIAPSARPPREWNGNDVKQAAAARIPKMETWGEKGLALTRGDAESEHRKEAGRAIRSASLGHLDCRLEDALKTRQK